MEGEVPFDVSALPHLTPHHVSLAQRYAQGLGDKALKELLISSPEEQLARLAQFESFVLQQRDKGAARNAEELTPALKQTQAQLHAAMREKEQLVQSIHETMKEKEQLAKSVAELVASSRARKKKPVRAEPPKFVGSDGNKLEHWLLAVEHCGRAQLIEEEEQMVTFAMSFLRGRASEWAYSTLLTDGQAFYEWSVFKKKIRIMCQPPNNEVLLQGRFFACRQNKRTLLQYVQEMRTLCASITKQPLTESVKVPAFMNGLRNGPARQALFRKKPSTMEDAISIAFVEEQSSNSGMSTPWKSFDNHGHRHAPRRQNDGPEPMDLSNAEEPVCYNCGKRGHMKAQCKEPPKQYPTRKGAGGAKKYGGAPSARRSGGSPTSSGNGNSQ